jgi:hypothetical protein
MLRQFSAVCGLLTLVLSPAIISPANAEMPVTAGKIHRVFDVVRDGSKIGTDIVDIEKQGDTTIVKFTTKVLVKIMFIEAYRFESVASETWKGGQFVAFKSVSDDNGTKHTINVTSSGEKFHFEVDGRRSEVPKMPIPGTLWSRDVSKQNEVFDPSNGKRLSIKVKDLGDETLTIGGTPRQVRHFKVSGDLERDLWYDGDYLIRMKLIGSDNTPVISDLRQATADPTR